MIRLAEKDDLPHIVGIYNEGILTYKATADEQPVTVASKQQWFEDHLPEHRPIWVLINDDDELLAWFSINTFYGRPAYNATVEVSLYVRKEHQRCGYGRQLLEYAIEQAPGLGINCFLGFIFGHNEGSIRLFKNFNFEEWGHLRDVAFLNNQLCDLIILGRRI
jgi:L-amino acid N-acyltransferase YncA